MSNTVTINTKYQVTIPKEIRQFISYLKPKQKVIVTIQNGDIVIKPEKNIRDFVGIMGKPPKGAGVKGFNTIRKNAYSKLRKI